MGRFVPASPIHIDEFGQRGIHFDHYRLCAPLINEGVLWESFGPNNSKFMPFLIALGNGYYELKEEFSTQQKVEAWFAAKEPDDDSVHLRQGLFDLLANVIFLKNHFQTVNYSISVLIWNPLLLFVISIIIPSSN
jgi:4-alpha-glucanotransferase